MAALKSLNTGKPAAKASDLTVIDGAPHMLDDALGRFGRGDFDLMGIGRMLVTNPDLVNRIRSGDYTGVRPYQTADLLTLE